MVKPQSNTRQIQEFLVLRLIAKIGYRWNNATCAGIGIQLVRDIVVNKNIAGYGELYDDLRKQNQKAELQMMKFPMTPRSTLSRKVFLVWRMELQSLPWIILPLKE
jgi:hypothetical protein